MVEHVAEIRPGLHADQHGVAAQQGGEQFAQGHDGLADEHQFPPQPLDGGKSLGPRPAKQVRLHRLDRLLEGVGQSEIAVHHRVHDHISEVVAAQAADAAAALDESLAEGVEQVVPALAEGDEQAGEDEQADLFVLHGLRPVDTQGLEDDEQAVVDLLELGPLMGVEDVLEHQRVHLETGADFGQQRRDVEPLAVHPGGVALAAAGEDVVNGVDLALDAVVRAVADQGDAAGGLRLRAHMHQRPGRQAGLARGGME